MAPTMAVVPAALIEDVRVWATLSWAALPEKDLGKVAAIVTILSLVITPVLYFVKRWYESQAERRRVSQNFYLELGDTRDVLDTEKSGDLRVVRLSSDETVYFMNRKLNHDFYDSLVFSGKINFVKPELQQRVQDVFHHIKDHNFCLHRIHELEDLTSGNTTNILEYYRMLGEADYLLRTRIPELVDEFKSEYGVYDRPGHAGPKNVTGRDGWPF